MKNIFKILIISILTDIACSRNAQKIYYNTEK
jgi:hypothetical protein